MTSIPRPYADLPKSELHRTEFALPAGTMARVSDIARRYSRVLPGGRNQVLAELLDGYLARYEADILRPRRDRP